MIFCGDTSLGDWYLQRAPEHVKARLSESPIDFFSSVRPLLQGADALVLNLETVLWENPESPFSGVKPYLGWDKPDRTLSVLKDLKVTAVSLSNNHAMDFGEEGLSRTTEELRMAGIDYFGAGENLAESASPWKAKIEAEKTSRSIYVIGSQQSLSKLKRDYSFYAGTSKPGVNPLSTKSIHAQIKSLRKKEPDCIIIAFPHWGNNYKGITDNMRSLAAGLAESGVDIILGHGAHMLQSIESFDETTCIYSLGNFVFNSRGRYSKLNAPPYSLIAKLELEIIDNQLTGQLKLYPIVTDNLATDYRSRPVTKEEFSEVEGLIKQESFTPPPLLMGSDSCGYFFTFKNPLSPRISSMPDRSAAPPSTRNPQSSKPAARRFRALSTAEVHSLYTSKDEDRYGEGSTQGCIATALQARGISYQVGGVDTTTGILRPAIHFQIGRSWYITTGARVLRANSNGDVLGRLDGEAVMLVKQKDIAKSVLRYGGFSVPEGECFNKEEKDLANLYFKVMGRIFENGFCMKPSNGGLGKDVHVGIRTQSEFEIAFDKISKNGRRVLMEKVVLGPVYRVLYVGGKVSAIRVGRPKSVVGDGASSISQLVKEKSKARAQNPLHKHYPLRLGKAEISYLEAQGLTPQSIPEDSKRVFLSAVSNRHAGADVIDVTDEVHISYREVIAEAVSTIPGIAICGADVIIPDCSTPATSSNYAIIELNTGPGFADHHYPWEGKPRDVAGDVINMLVKKEVSR